jgi:hypothetical protein
VSPNAVHGDGLASFNKSREYYYNEATFYTDIWCCLEQVDEYIVFKKHFATALDNDKDRIEAFLEGHAPMRRIAEVVFRCRRVKFPKVEPPVEEGRQSKPFLKAKFFRSKL